MENDLIDKASVEREIANQSRLLFADRAFVERYVFPRGYDETFCAIFRVRWGEMDGQGVQVSH